MEHVLLAEGVSKTFNGLRRGPRVALAGLDLAVAAGEVHGFLGPNGSGKTTTLRILMGLARADAGRMWLLGRPVPAALPEVAPRIGAIVESPRFFGNFTGRQTLRLLARAAGLPDGQVNRALELVGLTARGDERVRAYSLGMRQRLAMASALLRSPELLILDEPANGLDPAGIREMRDLIRGLAAAGTTVLLSSHILAEVEQICDAVTIISNGRRVTTGPVGEVLASQDRGEYRVRVAEHRRAAEILTAAGMPVRVYDDQLVVGGVADPARITETLSGHRLWVGELTPLRPDLEDVFLRITGVGARPETGRPVDEGDPYAAPPPMVVPPPGAAFQTVPASQTVPAPEEAR